MSKKNLFFYEIVYGWSKLHHMHITPEKSYAKLNWNDSDTSQCQSRNFYNFTPDYGVGIKNT